MSDVFYLDIGGVPFKSYKSNLRKIPYFDNIFSQNKYNKSGTKAHPYFLDRDPEHFKHVLNYVRDKNYEIPKEAMCEFKFLGFDFKEKKSNEKTKLNNHKIYSNLRDDYFNSKYYHHGSSKEEYRLFNLNGEDFTVLPWTFSIEPNDLVGNFYLLIPEDLDLSYFTVDIKIKNKPLHKYNLEVSKYFGECLKHSCGYVYVPLYIYHNHHHMVFNIIEVTLKSKKYCSIDTGLRYEESMLDSNYKYNIYKTHPNFYLTKIEENISHNIIFNPDVYYRFVIWRTEDLLDHVILDYEGERKVIPRCDFQCGERIRVGLEPLPDYWGCMYFCKEPLNHSKDSGGLVVGRNSKCELLFPDKTRVRFYKFYLEGL